MSIWRWKLVREDFVLISATVEQLLMSYLQFASTLSTIHVYTLKKIDDLDIMVGTNTRHLQQYAKA